MIHLQIEMTEDELQSLRRLAREQGFATPEAYLKSLALEPTRAELLEDIRGGLLAIKRGEPMPTLDDLWRELDSDDDDTTS